jgi:hypothetical protein
MQKNSTLIAYFYGRLTSTPTKFPCQYTFYYQIKHLISNISDSVLEIMKRNTGMRNNKVTKGN